MKPRVAFNYGWVLLAVSFTVLFFRSGARTSLGLFMGPLQTDLGWSRASISLAVSISLVLYAVLQAGTGWIVDRYGPRVVISVGALALGASTLGLAAMTSLWQLYLLYGVLGSLGTAATAIPSHSTLVSRWFSRRRALVLSLTISGMAIGQMVMVPLIMKWVLDWGWRSSVLYLGGLMLLVPFPLAALLIRDRPPASVAPPAPHSTTPSLPDPRPRHRWQQALGTRYFWSLAAAYFACGFSVHFISTHLVPLAAQMGFGQIQAASAFGLMGGLTAVGVISVGAFADRVGHKNALAGAYSLRAVGFFSLAFATTPLLLYVSAAVIGLSFLATDPLTTTLIARQFGIVRLGTLLGAIAAFHQVGGAAGAYLGGAFYDWTGSYLPILGLTVALLLGAAALSLTIPATKRQAASAEVVA